MLCGFRRILIGEAFVWKPALGVADTLGEIWSRVLTPVHFPTPTSCDIMCSDMIGHLLFRKCCLNFSPTVPLLSLFLFQNNLYTASVLTCTPLFFKKKKAISPFPDMSFLGTWHEMVAVGAETKCVACTLCFFWFVGNLGLLCIKKTSLPTWLHYSLQLSKQIF